MDKQLFIIYSDVRAYRVIATYKTASNRLLIKNVKQLPDKKPDDVDAIKADMRKYKSAGYLVAVCEQKKRLSKGGFTNFDMSGRDEDGSSSFTRTILNYEFLSKRKAIKFPDGARVIKLSSEAYEQQVSATGEISYLIDHEEVTGEVMALLATIYAATTDFTTDASFLQQMQAEMRRQRLSSGVIKHPYRLAK